MKFTFTDHSRHGPGLLRVRLIVGCIMFPNKFSCFTDFNTHADIDTDLESYTYGIPAQSCLRVNVMCEL